MTIQEVCTQPFLFWLYEMKSFISCLKSKVSRISKQMGEGNRDCLLTLKILFRPSMMLYEAR